MSTHKKQHSVIFMRAWLITIIGQCQVKSLNTELTIAWFYKAVVRFMTNPNAPSSSLLIEFITQNDIHDHLEAGYPYISIVNPLRTYIHTCIHTCMHTYIHTYIESLINNRTLKKCCTLAACTEVKQTQEL